MKRIRRDKRREARKNRSIKRAVRIFFSWIISIVAAAILGYGVIAFCFQSVYMVGSSMSPAISDGSRCRVSKAAYILSSPDRYDIVAYRQRENSDSYYDIKRVIGLPGEKVQIADGKIYIDGEELSDVPFDDYIFTAGLADTELTLGDDEYFLMGDNVNNSADSRYVNIGNISEAEILGKVVKH
jgi:signal peptidase I